MTFRVEGLKELRQALKQVERSAPREITKALREGAVVVTARARMYAPRESGKLQSSLRPYATQKEAGVRSTLVYAGVQEFGVDWRRQNRGRSGTQSEGSGTNVVHYTKDGSTPRFAFKAVDDVGPELIESTFVRLTRILVCHGWFE